jgi:hypothetical protein
MPDLSNAGLKRTLRRLSPALRDALAEQQRLETWTVDDDPDVGAACVGLGRALDVEEVLMHLMTVPAAMDGLRTSLPYLKSARRLRMLEHLGGVEALDQNVALALIDADGTMPPRDERAALGCRIVRHSIRHLHARHLIREIFAAEVLELVLKALGKQGQREGEAC